MRESRIWINQISLTPRPPPYSLNGDLVTLIQRCVIAHGRWYWWIGLALFLAFSLVRLLPGICGSIRAAPASCCSTACNKEIFSCTSFEEPDVVLQYTLLACIMHTFNVGGEQLQKQTLLIFTASFACMHIYVCPWTVKQFRNIKQICIMCCVLSRCPMFLLQLSELSLVFTHRATANL